MELLDHTAVERGNGAAFRLGCGIGIDDALGFGNLFGPGREGLVCGRDLVGMDQRLAGEAEIAPLAAGGSESIEVLEIGQHRSSGSRP